MEKVEINTANKHLVARHGDRLRILNPPSSLTPDEALVFAAWLVAMAYDASHEWVDVLNAVQST